MTDALVVCVCSPGTLHTYLVTHDGALHLLGELQALDTATDTRDLARTAAHLALALGWIDTRQPTVRSTSGEVTQRLGDVVRLLTDAAEPMTAKAVTDALGLRRAEGYRYLARLVAAEYVTRTGSGTAGDPHRYAARRGPAPADVDGGG